MREGVPVVEHEVAHAQEGELLQAPRARVQAQRALRNAVKGALVVPLQRVLAAQGDARCRGRLDDLLQQPCRQMNCSESRQPHIPGPAQDA